VKYTFDNVGFDFLPAQWLVHVSDVKATMTVGQPFPDVWLPTSMELNLAMTVAIGQLDVRLRPSSTATIAVPQRHQQNRHQVDVGRRWSWS